MAGVTVKFSRGTAGPGSPGMAEVLLRNLENGAPEVMESVAETIKEFVDSRWDLQADPWGNAWKPLSPKYLAWRIRKASGVASRQRLPARAVGTGGVTILLFRQDLRRGWIPQWDGWSAWIALSGPATKYGRRHQFGDASGKGARAMVPLRLVGGTVVNDTPRELKEEITALVKNAVGLGLIGGT